MTVVFDCERVADKYLAMAAKDMESYVPRPVLAIVRKSDDPASVAYERAIERAAKRAGVLTNLVPTDTDDGLRQTIEYLNLLDGINGIFLMSSLGCSKPDSEFANMIDPAKDVEGRHAENLGRLFQYQIFLDEQRGVKCVVPATPKATVKTLMEYGHPKPGKSFAIINDSGVVGRPLGMMLKNLKLAGVICDEHTDREYMESSIRSADYLVTAVPDPKFRIKPELVKPGAVVMDLSYEGNLDYPAIAERASYITPERGGLAMGKVTTAMVFVSLGYCMRRQRAMKGETVH